MEKKFKIEGKDIKQLIPNMGYCIASDMITFEGMLVGFMYREEPDDYTDSGWRFFSGSEDQEYVDNPDNSKIYDVNTIAIYDNAIIKYLNSEFETEFERIEGTDKFNLLED